MEDIIIVGKNQLTSYQLQHLERIVSEYYYKIKRALKNLTSVKIIIKKQSKGSAKFSIHVQVIAPTKKFVSTHGHDFDFVKALRKAFNDIEVEIEHTFHVSDTLKHIHHSKYFLQRKEFLNAKRKRKKRN